MIPMPFGEGLKIKISFKKYQAISGNIHEVNYLQFFKASSRAGSDQTFKTYFQLRHQGCYVDHIVAAAGNLVNEIVII
jgi:hypothetical protein